MGLYNHYGSVTLELPDNRYWCMSGLSRTNWQEMDPALNTRQSGGIGWPQNEYGDLKYNLDKYNSEKKELDYNEILFWVDCFPWLNKYLVLYKYKPVNGQLP